MNGSLESRQSTVMHQIDRFLSVNPQYNTKTQKGGIHEAWMPSDFLPDFAKTDWPQRVEALQQDMRGITRDLLIILIGDTVTEEGLPTFAEHLYTLKGIPLENGRTIHTSRGALVQWMNAWVAEEEKHGELLSTYLRLSGKVDMIEFERTKGLFLMDGMDIGTDNDPYNTFVYTTFQEAATQRSHANTAILAKDLNIQSLNAICRKIASDEAAHGASYSAFVKEILRLDPDGMMQAIKYMLVDRKITMPAHNMKQIDPDSHDPTPAGQVFDAFSEIAQRIGVYTYADYVDIQKQCLERWQIAKRTNDGWSALEVPGLTELGLDAQNSIIKMQRVLERSLDRKTTEKPSPTQYAFAWVDPRMHQ